MSRPRDAKVVVCADTDATLNPCGKVCHPMGRPHLPGGLGRCHSLPNGVLTCPGSSLEQEQTLRATRGRDFAASRREEAMRHTVTSGSWAAEATLRPSASSKSLPGGGSTQGAKDLRPKPASLEEYDASKHGWYHPVGQAETMRLRDQKQPGSWAWTMHKARDHTGYGEDGQVDKRDVQITAVSGDAPDWLVGTRTLPGPMSTKKNPVRRCPFVQIAGNRVSVQAKTYSQGEGMAIIEHLHDRHVPPTPVTQIRAPRYDENDNQAKRSNMEFSGCQTRAFRLPPSAHVTYDGFAAPPMRTMDRR